LYKNLFITVLAAILPLVNYFHMRVVTKEFAAIIVNLNLRVQDVEKVWIYATILNIVLETCLT